MTTVTIGTDTFQLNAAPVRKAEAAGILHYKKNRKTLTDEKLTELFEKAATPFPDSKKFRHLNYQLEDPNKLEDTYNLQTTISTLRDHHVKFDMHNVFEIVKYEDGSEHQPSGTIDLYTDYPTVTVEEVARSNQWYRTMVSGDQGTYVEQNLNITAEHLMKSCQEKLLAKVKETYDMRSNEEQGGPLFFKLLMDTLQIHSKEAAEYLVTMVKNLKISNIDGENVSEMNSKIRGAINRLKNLKDENGKSHLPDDMPTTLLEVYQTSSVEDFNNDFAYLRRHQMISKRSTVFGPFQKLSNEDLIQLAETTYANLVQRGLWNGVNTKANATQFVASKAKEAFANRLSTFISKSDFNKKKICFNCGGDHLLHDCTQPKNEKRITAMKQKFWDKRKKVEGGGGGGGNNERKKEGGKRNTKGKSNKWKPPTEEEKANHNRRMIDGNLNEYNESTRRWSPVSTSGGGGGRNSNLASEGPPTHRASNTTSTGSAERDVALANASNSINQALRGLMQQFNTGSN